MSAYREETIGGQRLICGNAEEVLLDIPAETCATAITDPPYGTDSATWDKDPPPFVWAALKLIAADGPLAVFGYPECHLRWAQFFAPLKPIGCIAWWHYNFPCMTPGLTRHWQEVVIWGLSLKQVNAGAVREPYSDATPHMAKFCKRGREAQQVRRGEKSDATTATGRHPDGRRMTDLWRIPTPGAGFNSHLRRHRNEKPMECMERLVRLLSTVGETVIDPYMGSGTTLAAAELWGRNGIGIEQDAEHFDTACRRVEEAVRKREQDAAQLTLEATA